jgi:hypothetical protein
VSHSIALDKLSSDMRSYTLCLDVYYFIFLIVKMQGARTVHPHNVYYCLLQHLLSARPSFTQWLVTKQWLTENKQVDCTMGTVYSLLKSCLVNWTERSTAMANVGLMTHGCACLIHVLANALWLRRLQSCSPIKRVT